jgi:hypothetical protein
VVEKIIRIIIFLSVAFTVSFGMAADQGFLGKNFKAVLSGSDEVPPVRTEGRGQVGFEPTVAGDQIFYSVNLTGIEGITMVQIQKGKKGENGPPVVSLLVEPRKEAIGGMFMVEGTINPWELMGPLKEKSVQSLIELMEAGEAYINVYTKKHPRGEIRGQLERVR